jgi:hypothetical protein
VLTPSFSTALESQADARIRTGDPFITNEVLYQLSYAGALPILGAAPPYWFAERSGSLATRSPGGRWPQTGQSGSGTTSSRSTCIVRRS